MDIQPSLRTAHKVTDATPAPGNFIARRVELSRKQGEIIIPPMQSGVGVAPDTMAPFAVEIVKWTPDHRSKQIDHTGEMRLVPGGVYLVHAPACMEILVAEERLLILPENVVIARVETEKVVPDTATSILN